MLGRDNHCNIDGYVWETFDGEYDGAFMGDV